MNQNVYWLLELEIQAGREKDFQALMKEMECPGSDQDKGLKYLREG